MTKETLKDMNEVSSGAVTVLKRYFQSALEAPSGGNPLEDKKLPDRALIMLGRLNGVESTRLKAIALQFQIAKHMGLQGEPLRPLLVELNPENFASVKMVAESGEPLAPASSTA